MLVFRSAIKSTVQLGDADFTVLPNFEHFLKYQS